MTTEAANFQSPHSNFVEVILTRMKSSRTGKRHQLAAARISRAMAKKAHMRSGAAYRVSIAEDGTITLIPYKRSPSSVDEQRRSELLTALEDTHRQFGNALRRLAE